MMQVPLLAFRSLGIGVNTRDLHTEAARDGAVPKALNIIPIPLSIVWNREFGRHILRDERMPLHLLPVRYGATEACNTACPNDHVTIIVEAHFFLGRIMAPNAITGHHVFAHYHAVYFR